MPKKKEKVNHPEYYGGDKPYEVIKCLEAWGGQCLELCVGQALIYLARAGKKAETTLLEDLEKARWWIDRRIQQLGGDSWNPK